MNEFNGFKVSDSVFEQLSFKTEPAKKENKSLGQADFLQHVSYTHLRAHETVLDLVCRLLLEKKNNKI